MPLGIEIALIIGATAIICLFMAIGHSNHSGDINGQDYVNFKRRCGYVFIVAFLLIFLCCMAKKKEKYRLEHPDTASISEGFANKTLICQRQTEVHQTFIS